MTTDALKKQAREHEQNEEWEKALRLYRRTLDEMEPGGEPEIALFNRVADLELRLGNVEAAIREYEQAIDLYLEADLPNNAIAICRKILRNVPGRAETFLRMGEIRARQGFGVDARQNVLTYAEMMESRGDSEAATAALVELVTLFPADVEARIFLGERLVALGEQDEGVAHLLLAWQRLSHQESDEAEGLEARIRDLDPGAHFPSPDDLQASVAGSDDGVAEAPGRDDFSSHGLNVDFGGGDGAVERYLGMDPGAPIEGADDDGTFGAGEDAYAFGEILIGGGDEEGDDADTDPGAALGAGTGTEEVDHLEGIAPPADAGTHAVADPEAVAEGDLDEVQLDSLQEVAGFHTFGEIDTEPPVPGGVPASAEGGFADDFADEFADADSEDLFDRESDDEDEDEDGDAAPLPLLGEVPGEAPDSWAAGPGADVEAGGAELLAEAAADADGLDAHRALVERAHETGDRGLLLQALSGLAAALERAGEDEQAEATHEQVLQLDPRNVDSLAFLGRSMPVGTAKAPAGPDSSAPEPGPGGDFVDLGALVLDEEEAKTTRWVVDDQRSGDEDADFAHMLSKFKAKVAQHITRDDARSSYDLGTAYFEMGLVDESIGMFQQALRAQPGHLASLEMLGQCFLARDEPQVAVRVLERALQGGVPVEDDLLGIYYFLAVSHERAGNRDEAREFYEKVFSLDINFKDVTDRLRALR